MGVPGPTVFESAAVVFHWCRGNTRLRYK